MFATAFETVSDHAIRSERKIRIAPFLALLMLAAFAASAPALGAAKGAAEVSTVKACGYMLSSAGGATVEYIRISDVAAPGMKGTFVFSGPGVSERKHLALNNKGLALTSFPVATPGTETLSVTLATRPATVGTFHFTLHPVASDIASKVGCTPR